MTALPIRTAPHSSIQWIGGLVQVDYHGNDLSLTVQAYDENGNPCTLTIDQPSIIKLRNLLDDATDELLLRAIDKSTLIGFSMRIDEEDDAS